MTQEDKRITIAEAFGWKPRHHCNGFYRDGQENWIEKLPDYFQDLNACHDVELSLPVWLSTSESIHYAGSRQNFRDLLSMISTQPIHATAAERAEALYQTLCNHK